MTLSPGLRTVCGRDHEDEPSLSRADRADQKPAGLLRQSDHIACLKITRRDHLIHNQTLAGVIPASSPGETSAVRQMNRSPTRRGSLLDQNDAFALPRAPGTCY